MMPQHFGYAIDKWYLAVLLPFGLRRAKDGVTLTDDGSFVATFGFFGKLQHHSRTSPERTSRETTAGGQRSVCGGHGSTTD